MSTVTSLLDRPVYTYPQVERLLGLSKGTARRWLNGYRRGQQYPPILRPEASDTRWVTWGEFVEVRLFAGYRRVDDIPAQQMRRVIEVLRRDFDERYPLAYGHTYIEPSGRQILWRAQQEANLGADGFAVRVADEQVVLAPWVTQFTEDAVFAEIGASPPHDTGSRALGYATLPSEPRLGEVTALRLNSDFPDITVDPARRAGEPVIIGRNLRVATLADLVRGGEVEDEVASWYNLDVDQVHQAIGYDRLYPRIA